MTLLLKQPYDLVLMLCWGIFLVALAETNLVKLVRINHMYLFHKLRGIFHNIWKAIEIYLLLMTLVLPTRMQIHYSAWLWK